MRKLIVGAVTAGAVLAMAGPAVAAPPEVSKKSCDAEQGVFAQDHGVKSCTTTAIETRTFTATLPRQTFVLSYLGTYLVSVTFTGTAQETGDFLVTTVQTQKGNGEVITTSSAELVALPTVDAALTCHARGELLGSTVIDRNLTDPSVCLHPWDYPLEDLFTL